MKYTHETLHKFLLRMQSLDYPGYKDVCQIFLYLCAVNDANKEKE